MSFGRRTGINSNSLPNNTKSACLYDILVSLLVFLSCLFSIFCRSSLLSSVLDGSSTESKGSFLFCQFKVVRNLCVFVCTEMREEKTCLFLCTNQSQPAEINRPIGCKHTSLSTPPPIVSNLKIYKPQGSLTSHALPLGHTTGLHNPQGFNVD